MTDSTVRPLLFGRQATMPAAPSNAAVWLADLTYTQQTIAADVMPNGIGGIATYAARFVPLSSPIRVFKYPETLVEALAKSGPPEVIGFSNYVWNGRLASAFARAIKRHSPKTTVVFGGPNYPTVAEEQSAWLHSHPEVDIYIIKEGEAAFAELLQALIAAEFDIEAVKRLQIPSLHAVTSSGGALLPRALDRITDLSEIPSPYTTGLLDEFFDGRLLPIIQTNRGCPFQCTFCVEGDFYYNKVRRNGRNKVDEELDYIGRKMQALRAAGGRNDLFIADSNFGMYREDLDTARALARTRDMYGWPEYINVATGKNQKERVLEASRIINGALRLSGSVQSLDPVVLEKIKRKNIDAQGLFDLGLQADAVGANTYSEIILALPGDSFEAHVSTIRTVMNAGFTNIYLFQLMLLPGTELASDDSKRQHEMVTRFRVLPRCYGHFAALGEPIVTAEIEEICVANSTLSHADYLQARRLHLLITIFYNDGVFASLLKLLRSLNVPIYDWIEQLATVPMPPELAGFVEAFLRDTQDELWERREDLEEFVQQPGIVEKFIAGDLGNNLLFVYKTLGITRYLEQLAAFARSTIRVCLESRGFASQDILQFVDDALTYHCASATKLFSDLSSEPLALLRYDVDGFLKGGRSVSIGDVLLPAPAYYRFVLARDQRALIERYLGIYGDSTVSVGRILSKVHVKKLFRRAVLLGRDADVPQTVGGENMFHLFGLQQ